MVRRSNRGNFIVETPIALFVFLFLFVFPFVDLAAITLRTTFLYAAAHNAAWEAARAHTYQSSLDGFPSSVQLASSVAQKTAAPFGGIKINSVRTNIVTTDIKTLSQSRQSAPLAVPADSSLNSYQVEVSVNGAVNPLIIYNGGGFTNIPGLTQPMILTFTDRQYCENPQGLNK
jgi:Flp pilus assembly protein TadG